MPLKTLALQYFHYSSTAPEGLSRKAELAAVVGLSEVSRRRRGLLSGEEERLKAVAPLYYPVYAYPWRGMSLLVKPFCSTGSRVKCGVTIDFHEFLGEIRRTAADRGEYASFLAGHTDLFTRYLKTKTVNLGEFIPDGDLASLLVDEAEAQQPVNEVSEGVLLFQLSEEEAERRVATFEEIWDSVRIDLDNLSSTASILKEELERQTAKIEIEMDLLEETAEKKIASITPSIQKTVKELERERDSSIRRIQRSHQQETATISRDDRKMETELRRLRQRAARFEREKERRKRRGDKHGEKFWAKELKGCRRAISGLEDRLRKDGEKMETLKSRLSKEIKEIQMRYGEKIRGEQRQIGEIEAQRDRKIGDLKEAIDQLEENTAKITEAIAKQAERKRLEMERLEDMVVPWKIKRPVVISIPFYLARYSSRNGVRYVVLPPVKIDTDRTVLTRVTRRLVGLEGKMTDLVRPFRPLSDLIMEGLPRRLSTDAVFASRAEEEAARLDILSKTDLYEILDGLEELVEKGLLSRSEASKIEDQKANWGSSVAG